MQLPWADPRFVIPDTPSRVSPPHAIACRGKVGTPNLGRPTDSLGGSASAKRPMSPILTPSRDSRRTRLPSRLLPARRPSECAILILMLGLLLPRLHAQNAPHIGYVYPAGGQQGRSFAVTVGGQFLDGATNAHLSGAGIEARVVEHLKPLTPIQANALREQAKELQERKAAATRAARRATAHNPPSSTNVTWTTSDETKLTEIRQKLAAFQRRPGNPAIAEIVRLEVTLAPDAEPGERDLRLRTAQGLSNPLVFCVGSLPEYCEKSETAAPGPAARPLAIRNAPAPPAETPLQITLPAVVNGQILPGDTDRFQFRARQYQELVVTVAAQQLIPYLPDAVPGWFQTAIALLNAKGQELAFVDDYRFHPDPVLHHTIPEDGTYVIEIRDAIYRGREDFVYRVTLGELPFITAAFPLGAAAGTTTTVQLDGWNLPADTLDVTPSAPGIHTISADQQGKRSNRLPFTIDTLPERFEAEPNSDVDHAQTITPSLIVNGHIDPPGDVDVFLFIGHAGDTIVAEVLARRLESPLDSLLELTDAAGRRLALNDDCEDKGAGLFTHHADSRLHATLPADGSYYLHLRDTQRQGGPEFAYRLRVSPPRPDYDLRVVPASLNFRAGSTVLVTAYALRKDGFEGDIELEVKDPPGTFLIAGSRIPAGQDQLRFTLTLTRIPGQLPFPITLEGRALIEGREVRRPGVPAEDQMQAFAYRHLVPAREMLATIAARAAPRVLAGIAAPPPIRIPAGGTAALRLPFPTGRMADRYQFELSEPSQGFTLERASANQRGVELLLRCDALKVKPGTRGNLIVNTFAVPAPASPAATKPQASRRRAAAGLLPAIPFEVVAQP